MMRSRPIYEIRVRGHLDPEWATWLDNGTIENNTDGEAVLIVAILDQAALNGLLNRMLALNLTVIAVNQVRPEPQ